MVISAILHSLWANFKGCLNKFRVTFIRIRFPGTKLKLIISKIYLDRGTLIKVVRKRVKRANNTSIQNLNKSSLLFYGHFYQDVNYGINPRNLVQRLIVVSDVMLRGGGKNLLHERPDLHKFKMAPYDLPISSHYAA